jgi:hypothetical protein
MADEKQVFQTYPSEKMRGEFELKDKTGEETQKLTIFMYSKKQGKKMKEDAKNSEDKEFKVVGYIHPNRKKCKENKMAVAEVTDTSDEPKTAKVDVFKHKGFRRTLGYLPVNEEETEFIEVAGALPVWIWILLAVILASLVSVAVVANMNKTPTTVIDGTAVPIDEDSEFAEVTEQDAEDPVITIPGYPGITVKEGNYVSLLNPASNLVYFKYTITDADGNTLYETNYIEPGKLVQWDAWNYVTGSGQVDLTFNISTVDIDTLTPCNGAHIAVPAFVSGDGSSSTESEDEDTSVDIELDDNAIDEE